MEFLADFLSRWNLRPEWDTETDCRRVWIKDSDDPRPGGRDALATIVIARANTRDRRSRRLIVLAGEDIVTPWYQAAMSPMIVGCYAAWAGAATLAAGAAVSLRAERAAR